MADFLDGSVLALLWAKSDPVHPLWCHLLDVAAVVFELLPYFGPAEPLPAEWTAALAGLHDVGKADPLFQLKDDQLAALLPQSLFEYVSADQVIGFRHEARSAEILRRMLSECSPTWPQPLSQAAARAIIGHHGRVKVTVPDEYEYPQRVARWTPLRRGLCDLVLDACRVDGTVLRVPSVHADCFGVRLLGITIVADWIASNPRLYTPPGERSSPRTYLEAARKVARRALDLIGLVAPTFGEPRSVPRWEDSWPDLTPRGIQPSVVELAASGSRPGLAIIEAPMGEGKTEAAFHLADVWTARLGRAGVYIALPTQATSNEMHKRYVQYLMRRMPSARSRLVHGMAWLIDDTAELPPPRDVDSLDILPDGSVVQRQEAGAWLRNLRRAMLAPHAVGTVDQVLFAALGVRFGVLRLLGLANKVLIIDEVHACDTYMRVRLERALAWCRVLGTPVILLSATLPQSHRLSLIRAYLGSNDVVVPDAMAYPLLTAVDPDRGEIYHQAPCPPTRASIDARHVRVINIPVPLHDRNADLTPLANRIGSSIAHGGCAAVIVNTVRTAQNIYRTLRDCTPADVRLVLFHARFPAWRRQEIEHEITTRFGKAPSDEYPRPERAIVVATQVVEQSLDLDFDVMFSELAPVDIVLQRIGRLWRHRRDRPISEPIVHLLVPAADAARPFNFGASELVYARLHLLRTLGALAERERIRLPADFRSLIENVYGDPLAPCAGIPRTELENAAADESKAERQDRAKASDQLIGAPDANEYRYPQHEFVVSEAEEGEFGNNLRAQTRDGSERMQAIFALTRAAELSLRAAADKRRLTGDELRRLFRTRVSVPTWWLDAKRRGNGQPFEIFGCRVVDLTSGAEGEGQIRYDPDVGLYMADA